MAEQFRGQGAGRAEVPDGAEVRKSKLFLERRQAAYRAVLGSEDNPDVDFVLRDLAKYCAITDPVYSAHPHEIAFLEGRRSVFARIARHLKLDPMALWERFDGRPLQE